MKKLLVVLIAVSLTLTPAYVSLGHLAAGDDLVVDNYLIDFGYDPANVIAGEEISIAFNLVNQDTAELEEFKNVWLRFSNDETIVFSGVLSQNIPGNVTFLYTFPNATTYQITSQFLDADNKPIVSGEFEIEVGGVSLKKSVNNSNNLPGILALVGLAILFFILLIIYFKKYASKSI